MSEVRITVNGLLFPLPNDPDSFSFVGKGRCVDAAFAHFRKQLLQHMKNLVPFVVEGHERIATFEVEVFVCD